MPRFYTEKENIGDDEIVIKGGDFNHIKNVLRMKIGEHLTVCDALGQDYECEINLFLQNEVRLTIIDRFETTTELPARITLYQGFPKKDKMELIIQKAVELGVTRIVPVMTKRVIVKIEDKKKELSKLERFNAISESAAKQSGRGIIPVVEPLMTFEEALKAAKDDEIAMIPYEKADNISDTKEIMSGIGKAKSISVFIGPEGGFEEIEIEKAINEGIKPVTLGKRILRTETAGLAILSYIMMTKELENSKV
ncbi:MAG: 16S rRNA (uracil(1498)-N(3))-methyltransferase [Lachnospiraceae bacterium]|nr:16S rRNA (uracil(1498)-N(3))-methyltransferase [Lachnospiraceae bacterium]